MLVTSASWRRAMGVLILAAVGACAGARGSSLVKGRVVALSAGTCFVALYRGVGHPMDTVYLALIAERDSIEFYGDHKRHEYSRALALRGGKVTSRAGWRRESGDTVRLVVSDMFEADVLRLWPSDSGLVGMAERHLDDGTLSRLGPVRLAPRACRFAAT